MKHRTKIWSALIMLLAVTAAVRAEENPPADAGAAENASAQQEAPVATPQPPAVKKDLDGIEAIIDILKEKGVITQEEAARFTERHAAGKKKPVPPGEIVKSFSERLKKLWLNAGKAEEDFNELALEHPDPEDMITQLFAHEVVGAMEAAELRELHRRNYLSGAVATVFDNREPEMTRKMEKKIRSAVIEEVKESVLPSWVRKTRLTGDLRLRYQGDFFSDDNGLLVKPDRPTETMNTRSDRHRMRIRFRLGVASTLSDTVDVAAGLATGNTTDPISTNTTLGDYNNKKVITLDHAYVRWRPTTEFTLTGGRMPNPWLSTDLVWDQDLNFDGVAITAKADLPYSLKGFATAGVFPIQEVETSQHDKWLFGLQSGVEYYPMAGMNMKMAVAYYDYQNIVGERNTLNSTEKDFTAPQFQQKGNTVMDIDPAANNADYSGIKNALASDYNLLNITAALDLAFWNPIHLILTGDYVRNLGFDQDAVEERVGAPVKKQIDGYQLGLTVGYPKVAEEGEWNSFLFYKFLRADAVLDAYTDSDFHLGGTNAKGWIFGGEYGLLKNVSISGKWMTADEIAGAPLSIDVFQLNLNTRF